MNLFTEDALIEQPAIRLFKDVLGWQTVNAYDEVFDGNGRDVAGTDVAGTDVAGTDVAGTDVAGTDVAGTDVAGTDVAGTDVAGTDVAGTDVAGTDVAGTDVAVQRLYDNDDQNNRVSFGRENKGEVVLISRLRPALEKLNHSLPAVAIELAISEIVRDRSVLLPVAANQEIYKILKDGVKVAFKDGKGVQHDESVKVIDWEHPTENDFLLTSQFWITGNLYTRRTDLLGFVNGLPLVFIELKTSHRKLQIAFQENLRDYKETIPQLFWYNAFIILSNGSASRIGSLSAKWEHFNEWKRINSEGEKGVISLDTILKATCDKTRLLDIIENFMLFTEGRDGLTKLIPKNHQFLGVNNAFQAVEDIRTNQGRLGVFWHTQGSGKSYSMIFFAQKVQRRLAGNWTFLIVTDRIDLDNQIYKNFAGTGAVTEPEASARSQSSEHLKRMLSEEDHRYIFTTIQKFGTKNGQTHPKLSDRSDIIVITDEAHRSQYDTFALNMRNALPNAAFIGFTGTPLMAGEERTKEVFGDYISVYNFKQSVEDNATVPLFYENRIPEVELVNENLNPELETVLERAELDSAEEDKLAREFPHEYDIITRNERLEKIAEDIVLHFMGRGFAGKAMVVSIDKVTAVKMYDKVKKHWNIQRGYLEAELETCDPMEHPDLEAKIAYMRQTDMAVVVSSSQNEIPDMRKQGVEIEPHRIRMNREDLDEKFKDPTDLFRIVFVCAMWMTGFDVPSCSTIYLDKPMRNHTLMQTIARANRVFGEKNNGLIVDYIGIFKDLKNALAIYGTASGGGIQPGDIPIKAKRALVQDLESALKETRGFVKAAGADLGNIIKAKDEFARIAVMDDTVNAILVNDQSKSQFLNLAARVDKLFHAILPDTSAGKFSVERKTIIVLAEKVRNNNDQNLVDISAVIGEVNQVLDKSIDVKEKYTIKSGSREHILDISKVDFEALKAIFEKSRKNVELVSFARSINEEEQRGISENLTEEELAIFDLLTRPNIKLTRKEREQVKQVAKELLDTLKAERLVLDWRKQQKTRAAVRVAIFDALEQLPETYTPDLYGQKCELVYQHVYDAYRGGDYISR